MPRSFRCTGCRSRLHVPSRWTGTSVACPSCGTRVVVPPDVPADTRFEGAAIERSLAALEPVAGGSFAAEDFALPAGDRDDTAAVPLRVTRRPWGIYAAVVAVLVVVAVVSFALGAWWASRGAG